MQVVGGGREMRGIQGCGCGCPRLGRSRNCREGLAGDSTSSGKLSPKRAVRRGRGRCRCGRGMHDGKDEGDDEVAMRSCGVVGPICRGEEDVGLVW